VVAEATTASAPDRPHFDGRPDHGAAAARTEELYAHHGRLVSGLCHALLRDRAEAEDAAQQTFLSAHRALLNGSSPTEPAAWLATIARNECWSRIRGRMRQPLPTADVEDERSSADPVEEAIRNADLAALWTAIAALPRQQRDALLLREFGGLSYTELAGALAVSGSAVESLLFRARHGVRTRLEAAYAGLTGGSWLEALVRLAGGLGGGLAPVAAKVAVVGVGAAVATGGYVAVPHVLDTSRPAQPRPVAQTHSVPTRALSAPVAVLVSETRRTAVTTAASHEQTAADDGSGRSGASDDGESQKTAGSDRSGRQEADRQTERSSTRERSDGETSASSSSGRDGSDDGGGSSEAPSTSGDGTSGGGVVTTAPNPVVTVAVPVADAPTVVGSTVPAADG
jgi:RNA polymerase sigma factor (sigma-70 family)